MIKKQIMFGYLSQLITLIGGVFFLIFLPKLGGIEVYGKLMLILSYVSIFGILMGTPIQEAVKKEIVENQLSTIGKKNILNGFILRSLINIIFFILFYFIFQNIKGISEINYLLIVGIFLFINFSGLPQSIFLSLHNNKYNFYFVLVEYSLQVIFLVYFFLKDGNLSIEDILLSFIVGYGIPTIISSFYILRQIGVKKHISKEVLKKIMYRYFMLSLSSISVLLLLNIDNIMIGYYFSDSDLGYYNVSTNIVNKTTIFSIALVTSILPLFHLKKPKEEIKKLFGKYFKILFLGNIVLSTSIFFILPGAIEFIYGSEYELSKNVAKIMFLFPIFAITQIFLSGILTNYGKYKFLMLSSFTIALLNILLNFTLIGIYGIYGVSLATIISYILWCAILYVFVYKILR